MSEVVCPNCGTSMKIANGTEPVSELRDGVYYLVPETVRNDNVSKVNKRLEALKEAGVNVDKLRELMSGNSSFKDIFENGDPILNEIVNGGFIRNQELFRRWITAQTWGLIKNPKGWTYAVRKRYDLAYVFRQTKNELSLLVKLAKKGRLSDKRHSFFTFEDIKTIFIELARFNCYFYNEKRVSFTNAINGCSTMESILFVVNNYKWRMMKTSFHSATWLNCFKGAGAYYTLQNLIRTHGLILPNCNNMNDSLLLVEKLFNEIISYNGRSRRWDILMSLLVKAVKTTGFELKY